MRRQHAEVFISWRRFLAFIIEPYKDVFRTSEKDVLRTSLRDVLRCQKDTSYTIWGRLHNVCRRLPLVLAIGQFGDVLRTSVLDLPWRYVENHMGMSIGLFWGTSSRRNFAEWPGYTGIFSQENF